MQQAEGQWNFVTAISEQEEQRGLCPGGQKLTFINIIMKGEG